MTAFRSLVRRGFRQRLSTPWGLAQSSEIYANGVVFHSTASHGGIKLDRARNMAMPGVLRVAGGWYEEDCEWAKVAIGFPDLFTDYDRCSADRTSRDSHSKCWEAVHGRRSAARRGGKECVLKCRRRWTPFHTKKKNN